MSGGGDSFEGRGGWADGLPTWVRAIALVGVPSLIALGLVWALQRDLPPMRQELTLMHQAVIYNKTLIEQQQVKVDSQLRLLRWICSNTAKSDGERQRCFDD